MNFIESSGLDYNHKILLHKVYYPADNKYNYDIADYVFNNVESYETRINILETLGFRIDENGVVWWDQRGGRMRQDRNGVRTAQDLERKYDFSSLVGVKKAIKNNEEGLNKVNKELERKVIESLLLKGYNYKSVKEYIGGIPHD